MAVDMTTAEEMLKIDYKDGLHVDINERVTILSLLQREGEDYAQEADTHRFAIKIAPAQNARTYGRRSPQEFARTDGEMVTKKVDVTYCVGYNPIRINPDVVWRAANGQAAMINMLRESLRDLRDAEVSQKERAMCTGYGHDVLFEIRSVPGGAPWTYGIENYGGLPGEQIGFILRHLNLLNMYLNVADPTLSGSPEGYRTVRNGGTAVKVTDWAATLGSETITVDAEIVGAQVGDVVYRSREDAAGVQLTTDGLMGLMGILDPFSLVDPFQTIASTDQAAKSFVANQVNANSTALSETFLLRAMTMSMVNLGGGREDGTEVSHVFTGNTATINEFAQNLTAIINTTGSEADRGRRVTYGVTREGFQPRFGYARKFLTYCGIPFVDGHLHPRNTVALLNLDDICVIHNGPPEGDWLTPTGGGPNVLRVPGGPLSEYVWTWMMELAARRRNGCTRIYGLTSPTWM